MRVSKRGVQAIRNAGYRTYYRYGPSSVIICESQKIKTKILKFISLFYGVIIFCCVCVAIKVRHSWGGDVYLSYQRAEVVAFSCRKVKSAYDPIAAYQAATISN